MTFITSLIDNFVSVLNNIKEFIFNIINTLTNFFNLLPQDIGILLLSALSICGIVILLKILL